MCPIAEVARHFLGLPQKFFWEMPKDTLTNRKPTALCLPQNGYPSRRRSLVDDARFETICVKQTKQSVLEDARLRANG